MNRVQMEDMEEVEKEERELRKGGVKENGASMTS